MPTKIPARGISEVMMPVASVSIAFAIWVRPPTTAKTLTRTIARRKLRSSEPTEVPMQLAASFDPMFQPTNAPATNRTAIAHMSCFVQSVDPYGDFPVWKY